MELTPEEKQKIYAEEKVRLAAQEKAKLESANEAGKKLGKGCLIFVGVVIVFSVILTLLCSFNGTKNTQKSSVDSEACLYIENKEFVPLAVNENSFDEFVTAAIANDSHGITDLIAAGKVFTVPSNTKILIIERPVGKAKVRILEGKNTGDSGWVPKEWIKQ